MVMRGVSIRALEWRARRFSDPADRLQFLRKNLSRRPAGRQRFAFRRLPATLAVLGAGLTTSTFSWMPPKHIPVSRAETISGVARRAPLALTSDRSPEFVRKIWLVQSTPQFDLYSNGLRIEDQYATSTAPRRYLTFANDPGGSVSRMQWQTEPAGIVYHTTESHLAPFEEDENQSLRRAAEGLLEYVRRRHSYHFVIDRFGRVFRIVRESDYADHAGNSIWADRTRIYINLNQSFFGVAFEASSRSDAAESPVNAAQIYAARILTEMLRARYGIARSNCVAHAQVSVNPSNYAVGYHRDWAANLPFAALGLADNYKEPLPSVNVFGFEPDAGLMGGGESSMAEGLQAAIEQRGKDAAAEHLTVERYREKLQKRYRDAIRALRGNGAYQENN